MPTTDAQGRTISDDGNYWWDGSAWQLIKRGFFDTLADSVEGAVRKVEGSQGVTPTSMAAPAAATPTAAYPAVAGAAPAPAPALAIPVADLLAYLGALRGAGVVTEGESEAIRMRIPGQA